MIIRGRCISIKSHAPAPHQSSSFEVVIRNQSGISTLLASSTEGVSVGDWIQFDGIHVKLLTPNRTPHRSLEWTDWTLDPRRLRGTQMRRRVEQEISKYFLNQNFIETRTPLLVPCPGMETHIRPFQLTTGHYLPTSPEFAMKRLLAGGLERIFQICPSFRDEPHSSTHHPEFTMLEWYRAFASDLDLMVDVETLIETLTIALHGTPTLTFQGKKISVKAPWPRLTVRSLFQKYCEIDLLSSKTVEALQQDCRRLNLSFQASDTWDDLYFRIWLNLIEPKLPGDQAVFVTQYPASQAALAVIDTHADGTRWAKRFEVYAGGLELGNAFEELTDPIEQRRRFVQDMNLREQIYGSEFPKTPLDEGFLAALTEGLPPCAGIAMGVDRLVMLFADEPEIEKTFWLNAQKPDSCVP